MNEQEVLVTGHTGFIGGSMYNFLLPLEGVEPVGYSKSKGQDIFDTKKLRKYIENADIVYHFAAYANPGESKERPIYTINTNVQGCLNVLEACRVYDTPMVYASSCEIYGNSKEPIEEDFELKPLNPYAASKAAADRICYAYHACYGMDIKIVRLFNPYGANQQLNKIIPVFYYQAMNGEDLTVHGLGNDTRDYVYIDDIIQGLWQAKDLPAGAVINLATGVETTTLDIATWIIEWTSSHSKVKFTDYPPEHGNIKNQVGSYGRAKDLLGWYPTTGLKKGIGKTMEWLDNVKR